MSKTRLRIRFTKQGDLRWISHLDLARLWERLLRRAGLQLAFSEGFHPKPRINFPSALALGVEALDEIVELEVVGEIDLEETEARIRGELPAGMQLLSLQSPAYALGKARPIAAVYRIAVPPDAETKIRQAIERLRGEGSAAIERGDKFITCDFAAAEFELELADGQLVFALPSSDGASIRPSELLELLGATGLLEAGGVLQRVTLKIAEPAGSSGETQLPRPTHAP